MTHAQDTTQAQAALLRNDSGIAAPVTDSCCEAASIISPCSATTEGLIPHEKLREAATPKASLIALDRQPAQPVKGYTHPTPTAEIRAGGLRYWPADLTNVRPEEWAQMSPKHVAEFAGTTEVWLLLEAAQKHIAELRFGALEANDSNDLCADGAHDFRPFTSTCSKCCVQYETEPNEPASPNSHRHSDSLRASSLREAMEREAARGSPCALIVGDTRVQVSYHGIKWYHDHQKTGQRSQSLTIEEFDQIVTKAMGIEATKRVAQTKAVNP
ncbi:hypothetical protein [Pseudomonas gingeri]|uniref:hypothetical protein n=1 Tax=Pseudomonas gingeri TaxID=117681 RepID=UPI0015BC539B|nr:hypothetical protein [Pseudomonas gingeri]NWD50784.1 hypothetical protein [Pseudomonas gingeri]